ncbi:MAG: MFS transporter [Gammaproteobacteria bacterium]|nr:MFS transporter [Gammaproteobacteria bacterium]
MTATERRGAFSLAAVYATRMMGLFMILPVFALYAEHLGSPPPSHALVGLAIGVYGLSQALLQIPFGLLSDRIGRKPVIIGGLLLFAAGSVVAATADTITGIIIGRALQGSGAIAAAILALAADLTRESCRARVMATIGMSIGLSFAVSLALGPILDAWIGVPGIFWLTVGLALLAILIILFAVPTPARTSFHRDAEPAPVYFKAVIGNPELRRLDLGIFILHMTLTATFIGLPLALRDLAGLVPEHHGYLYLPILLLALFMMVPLVIIAEKQRKIRQVYQFGILGICLSQVVLIVGYHSLFMIVAALLVFFICFNVLEALLPSLVVKFAPPQMKGTATGVYSTAQFLGAFCGGAVGGVVATWTGIVGIFVMSALMTGAWYLIARRMANPPPLTSQMLNVGPMTPEQARALEQELLTIEGVAESVVVPDEGIAYLKVDSKIVDGDRLEQYLAPEHKEA